MKAKNSKAKGVLVLAGLLEGTQGYSGLLPIPWDKAEFAAKVSHAIRIELHVKARIQHQATWLPEEESELGKLARGIGLRAWFVVPDVVGYWRVAVLLRHKYSTTQYEKASRAINRLSSHEPPIRYPWPHENPDDETAIRAFESLLLNRLGKLCAS